MAEEQHSSYFTNKGPLKTASLKDQAYRLIKDAIDLCSELGISRTPVREALIELQSEGFVVFVRGRGFKVVELTKKEAMDIIEMRRDIEMFGAELAAKRITDEQLQRLEAKYNDMVAAIDSGDTRLMYKLDYDFHNIIFEATGNTWLMETIKKLRDHFLRVETQSAFSRKSDAKKVFKEHEGVLKALQKRDSKLARSAMQNHLEHTYHRTVVNILGEDVTEANVTESFYSNQNPSK